MNKSYSWKPTSAQTLLLKACLFQDSTAVEAYEKWQLSASIEDLDTGSFRMLPLLYVNLKRFGIEGPHFKKIKGVYRQTWYANHILFHEVFTLLKHFTNAGIPTLLLKGAPLVFFHYKDFALRPMSDVDVLIHDSDLRASVDLLEKSGLRSTLTDSYEHTLWFNNTSSFQNSSGGKLELHWYAISQSRRKNIDQNFWRRGIPVHYQEVETLGTSPSDTLFHVCIHGAKWDEIPPIRWIADAIQIIRTSPVEWSTIVQEAKTRRLIVGIKETLVFLYEEFKAEIPTDVLKELSELPVTKKEVSMFESIQVAASISRKQKRPELWIKYKKLMSFKGVHPFSFHFILFLKHWWNLTHTWTVFFYVPVAFWKWLTRKIRTRESFFSG